MATYKDRAKDKEAADTMLATAVTVDADDAAGSDDGTQCGIGPCRPGWMRVFASKQVFLATFCFSWVLQGMFSTYFVSVITTLEKLFQLQSKTMGIVLSATEIGQIGSSLLLTYYGGQGHRPRWIASSMVLFGVAAFACSSPHFLFGHHQYPVSGGSTNVTTTYAGAATDDYYPSNVCAAADRRGGPRPGGQRPSRCEDDSLGEREEQSKNTQIVLAIFFISLLGVGVGQTAVYTLGIPFIDDNVASRESPLYFSITIGVRILGPSFGFLLGAFCTSLYADLGAEPAVDTDSPHWVGAWWLGLVGISVTLLLASVPMFAFPERLRGPPASPSGAVAAREKRPLANGTASVAADQQPPPSQQPQPPSQPPPQPPPPPPYNGVGTVAAHRPPKAPKLKDFPAAVKRLLRNDILMYRTASSVLHLLPLAGIYTFLPKYFESQFHFPTHTANMVTGIYGIMVMGIGIVISGVFILKKNPNARAVAAWIAFTALAYAIGMCILMFFGCPTTNISGLKYNELDLPVFESRCSDRCVCDEEIFSPICGADGVTYYSACHAGCRNQTFGTEYSAGYKFTDCQCMDGNMTEANPGSCKDDCEDSGFWYVALFSLFVFIHSTSEVGSMLLILRCVHPQDKAMALGLIQFAIGLFGNVPCPILYGAVVDSACLIWEMTCGKQGACSLYNSDSFRIFYHGVTGVLMMGAFFVDIVVWFKAGSINFEDDHQLPIDEEELSQLTPITEKTETTV